MVSVSEVLLIVGVLDAALNGATRLAASVGSRVTSSTVSRWDAHNDSGVMPNTAHSLQSSGLGSSVFGHAFFKRETYGPVTSAKRASLLKGLTFDWGHRAKRDRIPFRHCFSRLVASSFRASLAFILLKYSTICGRALGPCVSISRTPTPVKTGGNHAGAIIPHREGPIKLISGLMCVPAGTGDSLA